MQNSDSTAVTYMKYRLLKGYRWLR